MLRTRQRYQPAEKLAMVEYLPLGGDNITTRGIYRRSGWGHVCRVRQPGRGRPTARL